ncbi:MAG TPA: transglycosylase domain-containing protein, partial [Flavobacteriales bacterium]|nr:transglycosylase domain-containing protein [Flavobacteriales bacterium]
MAKKKSKSAKRVPWLKWVLIGLAVLVASFFALLQLVRWGVFGELPSEEELASIRHEQATLVYAEDGSLIGKLFAEDRTNVRYEELPRHLIDALVSTEDARFFSHQGVDGRSYIRVFFRTLLGGDKSGGGGSTISQQIIKNLYGRQRHGLLTVPVNKMKEALVAQRLERVLTKNDVLVLYFNSVPFGENTFCVESAAQRFFGKPAKKLTAEEGAVLVGMLKANTTYNPRLHPDQAKGRRDQVLALMRLRGHLTDAELDSLKHIPITLRYTGGDALELNGYFVAQVAREARVLLKEASSKTGGVYDLEKD